MLLVGLFGMDATALRESMLIGACAGVVGGALGAWIYFWWRRR